MHLRYHLLLLAALLATNLTASSIDFQVTSLGGNQYSYSYTLSGFALLANQEVDIRFDPALYGTLSNGIAKGNFDLVLLQPNNPVGTFGDYSALALVDSPSLAGPFSVDFFFKGLAIPGAQTYFINQYTPDGRFASNVSVGLTTGLNESSQIPEPGSFWLISLALLLSGTAWAIRQRRKLIPAVSRP